MRCNVGRIDRLIRIIIGLVIIVVGYIYENWWGAVGFIPFLTGLFRWCPLYNPFKIDTSKNDK